jgi:carboxymethylenebutenolidase
LRDSDNNPDMTTKLLLITSCVLFLLVSNLLAQDQPKAPNLPASDRTAEQTLKGSPRHGEWVDVQLPGSDTKIKSWVVYPERKETAGVVIVIHEIFGMTDWVRSVADQLAADGFIAVAPDLLSGMGPNGGGTESLGNNVGQTIRQISADEQAKRLDAVRDYAVALPSANGKTATIGFCWGGSASFSYATRQPKLNAAAVYYGSAPMSGPQDERAIDKGALGKIACPVMGFYGGNDNRITSTVDPTGKAMQELTKTYTPHVYEGAGHGFLRQQGGQNGANLKATQEAWPATIAFFKKNLE